MVISSQASQEWLDGPETRVWSPERTVKPHERGAVMYKKVTGIYAIRCGERCYFGSAVCTTGRINQHKRELKKGIHGNMYMQRVFNKYGDKFVFDVVEVCSREALRKLEQQYIDNHAGELFNLAKTVCELAPPEEHSARMKRAWANRTPEAKAAMSKKISATLKQRYLDKPDELDAAKAALAKGRKVGVKAKTSVEANAKRSAAAKAQWAKRSAEDRAKVSSKISAGMFDKQTSDQRSANASNAAKARTY